MGGAGSDDVSDMTHLDYSSADAWVRLDRGLARWPVRMTGTAGWVRCEPGWSWTHTLPDFDVWSVVTGRGEAWLGEQPVAIRPGTTIMLRPGDHIRARQHPDDRLTVAHAHYLHDASDGSPIPTDLLPPSVVQLDDPPAVHDLLRSVIQRRRRNDPPARLQAPVLFGAALLEIHTQAARELGHLPPPMDPRIRDAINRIRANPAARPSLAEAAEVTGLSAEHFSRIFRRETGRSFRDFCVETRLDRARELLTETALPLAGIARMLGYVDYRLFARQFATRHGRPPSDWRAESS